MELGLSIVPPDAKAEHTHTIIFLHRRGDTGRAMADSLFWSRDSSHRHLKNIFPSVRWVFPQADILYCERWDQDLSQWFDIWNILDFSDREELQAPGLRESVMSIRKLVHREAELVGGLDKIVLAGISQGAATAIHTMLNLDIPPSEKGRFNGKKSSSARLAAFMGFGCRLPFPGGTLEETREVLVLDGEPSDDIVRNTPVFLGHCTNDPLIFVELGRQLHDSLVKFGFQVSWHEYPDGGNWINSPWGMDDVVKFLKAQGVRAVPAPDPFAVRLSNI
ncbi:Alpha/Beta hydrolase protein [Pseudomassariella vexata]|uniref:Alpha/Beta hydrolase protein n=1 Tax=Pseudomassariella vexata TaxID=1141098 RepID=A0A1Y2DI47_9PEZI|nr:Alpha/Beta hydrolase protein [Pseudomassariella vexata]ORY58814.1 Alpha/Beta hydrolase protein [Pseudomassariella vexata]